MKRPYPYNLMDEWGNYTRPEPSPALSVRAVAVVSLALIACLVWAVV